MSFCWLHLLGDKMYHALMEIANLKLVLDFPKEILSSDLFTILMQKFYGKSFKMN